MCAEPNYELRAYEIAESGRRDVKAIEKIEAKDGPKIIGENSFDPVQEITIKTWCSMCGNYREELGLHSICVSQF